MISNVIAGNWKMNHGPSATRKFFEDFFPDLSFPEPRILIFPPAISLLAAVEARKGRPEVALGIQNIYWEPKGAYTGEHAAGMAVSAGAEYVLVGHSERRHVFGETDEQVQQKVLAAFGEGLIPLICVGETLEERQDNRVDEVIVRQIRAALNGIPETATQFLLAYEPVWAIGTGKTATDEMAQEVHADIRNALTGIFGESAAQGIRILYGGSMKPENASGLLSQPDVDGGLIGGASLNARDFCGIVKAALDQDSLT